MESVGQRAANLLSVRRIQTWADSNPGGLKPGQYALAHTLPKMFKAADFFLRTPTLTSGNFVSL